MQLVSNELSSGAVVVWGAAMASRRTKSASARCVPLESWKTGGRKRRLAISNASPFLASSFAATVISAEDDEEGKQRKELARDLVRNLLNASSSSRDNNNSIAEGCGHIHIPCDPPPLSFFTGSLELTYRERAVPDVENAFMHKCQLVSSPSSSPSNMARRFRCRKANRYVAHLFSQIAKHSDEADIQLSRFDLFHGHLFKDEDVFGILFHAKEYCRFDENTFNVDLGFCQIDSLVEYDPRKMQKRNVLWVACLQRGVAAEGGRDDALQYAMVILDTSHYSDLLFPGQTDFHTIYEGDFGEVIGDVFYFDALKNRKPQERVIVTSSTKC